MACLAAVSCGKVGGDAGGETHFLRPCESTCEGGYECLCGMCTLPCDSDAACSGAGGDAICTPTRSCEAAPAVCYASCKETSDCSLLGDDFVCVLERCRQKEATPPELQCESGCFPVTGYPQSTDATCADLTRGEVVACQCGEPAASSSCHTRLSDDTNWIVPDGEFAGASAWKRCGASTLEILVSSCDFPTCLMPPNSYCSREDTCSSIGCGNWQTNDNGCLRTPCATEADCPSDQRCVVLEGTTSSQCSYTADGSCNCDIETIDVPGAFCNPTSEAGPGGEWEELFAFDDDGTCTFDTCDYEWHVTPDGEIRMRKLGVESSDTLTSDDLAELELVINGPQLRHDIDIVACPQEGRHVTYGLVLPGVTSLMGVECFIEGNPENNPYQRIWTVLQKY